MTSKRKKKAAIENLRIARAKWVKMPDSKRKRIICLKKIKGGENLTKMLKKDIKNIKGQMTIIGLFLVFIMFVLLTALMPTIVANVTNLTSTPGIDTTTITFANLIPVAFVVALIGTIFIFARPAFGGA